MNAIFFLSLFCAGGATRAVASPFNPKPWAGARAHLEEAFERIFRAEESPDLDPLFRELWSLNLRLVWRNPEERARVIEYAVRGAVRAALERLSPVDPARARRLTARFIEIGEQASLEPGRALARTAEPMNREEVTRRRRIYVGLGGVGLITAGAFGVAHLPIGTVFFTIVTMMMTMKSQGMFLPGLDNVVGPAVRDCTSLLTQLQLRAGDDGGEVIEQADPA